ncbi:hypothetical protein J437_LFUL019518, partial [Ladona fulva]
MLVAARTTTLVVVLKPEIKSHIFLPSEKFHILTREGPTPTNISKNSDPETVMKGTFASPAVALASRSHTSTKEEHRLGCPVEVTTPKMIDKIHDKVLIDQRIKVNEIVEATGILQG